MNHTPNNFPHDELIFFLQKVEASSLPGFKAHLEITPYRELPYDLDKIPADARKGGVAVVVNYHETRPVVLLTKRMDYKGVHGGQISFPGGKQEPGDAGLLQTAIRETFEETGLVLTEKECVMPLSGIYIPPSNFYVQPYLFVTKRPMELTINHEVDYPILADLDTLMLEQTLQKASIRLSTGLVLKDAPCFVYNTEVIWGATAAILNELKWLLGQFSRK